MMTVDEYFNGKPHSQNQRLAAEDLIAARNGLRREWEVATGMTCPVDPDTNCEIAGDSIRGNGDGGFRLPNEGSAKYTSHKVLYIQHPDGSWEENEAAAQAAVDDYDPDNSFDRWLDQFETGDGGNTKLAEYGLYREHPDDTPRWCHLTRRAPRSGRRSFKP